MNAKIEKHFYTQNRISLNMVKFCQKCGSLFSHKLADDGRFVYSCHLCGYEDPQIEQCIEINEFNRNAYDYPLNPMMIYDVTLPRTRQIHCPKCKDNTEIIVFQYNPEILNVGYLCVECRSYWKN